MSLPSWHPILRARDALDRASDDLYRAGDPAGQNRCDDAVAALDALIARAVIEYRCQDCRYDGTRNLVTHLRDGERWQRRCDTPLDPVVVLPLTEEAS